MKAKKNNKGFSLIELIIAVAILVVLSGLLAPQLIKYIEKSRESKDMQTIDSVYVAVNTALADEKAYGEYAQNTNTFKTGCKLEDLFGYSATLPGATSPTTNFADEVKSILGKSAIGDIKMTSKKAKAISGGVIYVKIDDNGAVSAWYGKATGSGDANRVFIVGE